MLNLPVIVTNYGKPVTHLNMCYSLIAITLNGISFVGRFVENQRQSLISIVVMRLSCQLNMCQSLIAITVNCISMTVWRVVENQRQCLIPIVIMKFSI